MSDFDQPDPEETPALPPEPDAYVRARAGAELFGQPLRAYTRTRYTAAQSMGLLYPCIGDEGLAQYNATGMYPGQVRDVMLLLWVCTIPHASEATAREAKAGIFTVERALMKPGVAAERALEWGVKNGLADPADPRFDEAHKTFGQLVRPVEESRFEIQQAGGTKGGGADDPKPSAPATRPSTP